MKYYGFAPIKPSTDAGHQSCPGGRRGDGDSSGAASPGGDPEARDAAGGASPVGTGASTASAPGPSPEPRAPSPGPRPGRWWFASVGHPPAIQKTEAVRIALAQAVSTGEITFGHYVVDCDGARVRSVYPAPLGVQMLPAELGAHVALLIDSDPPVLLYAAPTWAPARVPALVGCTPRVLGGAA